MIIYQYVVLHMYSLWQDLSVKDNILTPDLDFDLSPHFEKFKMMIHNN